MPLSARVQGVSEGAISTPINFLSSHFKPQSPSLSPAISRTPERRTDGREIAPEELFTRFFGLLAFPEIPRLFFGCRSRRKPAVHGLELHQCSTYARPPLAQFSNGPAILISGLRGRIHGQYLPRGAKARFVGDTLSHTP